MTFCLWINYLKNLLYLDWLIAGHEGYQADPVLWVQHLIYSSINNLFVGTLTPKGAFRTVHTEIRDKKPPLAVTGL